MIKIARFTFNPLSENTYVLHKDGHAVVIDPGMYEKHEQKAFCDFLQSKGLKLDKIVNTHCHLDHVAGVSFLQHKFKVPFFMPSGEEEVLKMSTISAGMYGMNLFQEVEEFQIIPEGETIEILGENFQVLYVPGHSPGHLAFYNEEEKVLLSGDVLFKDFIGRYDLPGGDLNQLIDSIKNKLFKLPEDTQVLSGHGDTTTIGYEKQHNVINTI